MSREAVLVTGCAGFIGSHIIDMLLSAGHDVIGIDCFTPYYPENLKKYNLGMALRHKRFKLIELDLSSVSIDDLARILKNVKYVIHEAAQPGVRSSWGLSFDEYVKHNIMATQRLLEAILKVKGAVRRLVYASSSSVYGDVVDLPMKEEATLKPHSPYGVTKLTAENLCKAYYENFSIPIVILRYFTVYGPRQRPDMAFHRFIKSMLKDTPIEVFGVGDQRRDFTYVDDVVEATIMALEHDEAVGEIINIGSSNPVRLIDAIKMIAELIGVESKIVFKEEQKGDVKSTYADISKARQLLDWKPSTNLKDGLASQISWMRQAIKANII